jgi:uncharacterized protein (DUF983 family)
MTQYTSTTVGAEDIASYFISLLIIIIIIIIILFVCKVWNWQFWCIFQLTIVLVFLLLF